MKGEMQSIKSGMQGMKSEMHYMKSGMQNMNDEIQDVKRDTGALKRQIMKSTAELKAMDEIILDEVERVHDILNKRKEDKAARIA